MRVNGQLATGMDEFVTAGTEDLVRVVIVGVEEQLSRQLELG